MSLNNDVYCCVRYDGVGGYVCDEFWEGILVYAA